MVEVVDLFGETRVAPGVSVSLYADRIKRRRNPLGQWWTYVGLLAIPDEHHATALQHLDQERAEGGYHRELHFVELKRRSGTAHGEKTAVAKRWVQRVMWDDRKIFHFHFLGINLSNLDQSAFGTGWEQPGNIYNRFFRSAVASTLKGFFGPQRPITVSHIFHDKDDMESDDLFDWHTIWKLSSPEHGISFATDKIRFIDSDHEKKPLFPQESHLVQLTDVLTGGISQCLDATSGREGSCEVAECLLPLVDRLTDRNRVSNPNSRFRYVRRLSIAFFPRKKLSRKQLQDLLERARSGLYIERPLLLRDRLSTQMTLL